MAFQTSINVLFAITSWCQYQMLTLTGWVGFETVDSLCLWLYLLDWNPFCGVKILDALYWRIELLHWILNTSIMNLYGFRSLEHHSWKFNLVDYCFIISCLISTIDICLESFDRSSLALHYYWIKIMWVACHFKNYFVLSFTYSRTSRN